MVKSVIQLFHAGRPRPDLWWWVPGSQSYYNFAFRSLGPCQQENHQFILAKRGALLYSMAMGEAPDCIAAIMFREFLLNNNTLR